MQVDRAKKHIVLGVRVDPTNRDDRFSHLRLKQFHLVDHGTLVGRSCLSWNDQVRNYQFIVLLNAAEDSTSLRVRVRVRCCRPDKSFDDFQWAYDVL